MYPYLRCVLQYQQQGLRTGNRLLLVHNGKNCRKNVGMQRKCYYIRYNGYSIQNWVLNIKWEMLLKKHTPRDVTVAMQVLHIIHTERRTTRRKNWKLLPHCYSSTTKFSNTTCLQPTNEKRKKLINRTM
jgi:hypothetical protein